MLTNIEINQILNKLDNTKISCRKLPHSSCSMRVIGVYPEGTKQEEVEKEVQGTFGGRFVSFDKGRFEYIAYTD
jgi:hypothetical protein